METEIQGEGKKKLTKSQWDIGKKLRRKMATWPTFTLSDLDSDLNGYLQ